MKKWGKYANNDFRFESIKFSFQSFCIHLCSLWSSEFMRRIIAANRWENESSGVGTILYKIEIRKVGASYDQKVHFYDKFPSK